MKRFPFAFVLAALAILLSGCATPIIRSEVSTFHEWPAELREKTYAFQRTKDQENNLEYSNYENLVRAELIRLGFSEARDARSAALRASIGYNVDVRDVRVAYPVVVDPYWGSPWRGGYYSPFYSPYYGRFYSPFYSPFYDPFWYGPPVVERREENYQVFTRRLKITLVRASDGKQLYDTTVVSEGRNGSLAVVMPYLVRSAFADFPGRSGVPRVVEMKMKK